MTQAVLIRNADLYAPEHVGMRDILIAGGKIIAVEPHLENVNIPGMETVDAAGRRVTPGLIDQHIHVTGGGKPLPRAQFLLLGQRRCDEFHGRVRHRQHVALN